MRPIRLTVRAFGPYADEQTVDFDALRDDGLFLIHGATGSGKTFLLDALSFALYGEVSGGRSVASLRSDHAAPEAEPMVVLELEAHGERWLVERVPPHQRLGLRAGSLVDKPARASLSRRAGDRWAPEATGVKEVGQRIGDLIGLTARQFRQVIVLPQGRFEEVLLASSDTREELLKTLFDSVLFESVALHLDRRARDAAEAVAGTERDLIHLRRQADERWHEVSGEATDAQSDAQSDATPSDAQAHLDALADRATRGAAEAATVADRAEQDAAAAARADADARALDERCRLRDQLLATRAELRSSRPTIDADRARLARDDAARAITPSLDQLAAAADEAERADHQLRSCAARLGTQVDAARAPVPDEVQALAAAIGGGHDSPDAGDAIGPAHDALAIRRSQLDELATVAERVAARERDANSAERESTELDHRVERARFELARLASTEDDLRGRLRAADDAAAQLDGIEASARALAEQARAAALLADAADTAERRRHDHTAAEAQLHDAEARAADQRAAHLEGIAAVLAAHLTDGDACRVCGATEHPHPAVAGPGAVTAQDVEAAEHSADAARRDDRRAAAEAHRAESALASLRREAGLAAGDPDAALEHAQTAIALVASTAETAATGGDLLDQLDALVDRRAELTEQIDADVPRAAAVRRDAATLRTQAEADGRRLHDALGEAADLDRARSEADALLAAVDDLLGASVRVQQARTTHAAACAVVDDLIDRSAFADRDAVAGAVLAHHEHAAVAAAIAEHDQRVAAVDAQLELPDLVGLPLVAPSLDGLHRAACDARTEARAADDRRARSSAAAGAIAAIADRHRALELAFGAEREQAEVRKRVADQCMGRVGDKVSLQRWVLATYLQEICELATARLLTMSSHRYSLRVHRDRASRGARSGLDLRVFDAHTGEERAVHSLSGGETFQASLALALAVADSVQQHAGGVQLDTLFVDEGFGTLDPHSLELAIDELDRLRAGGRTVGIISHVAALRERIRVGIEVTATTRGSSLRVGDIAAA